MKVVGMSGERKEMAAGCSLPLSSFSISNAQIAHSVRPPNNIVPRILSSRRRKENVASFAAGKARGERKYR